MRISRQLLDEVIAHAQAEAPKECVGMIASRDGEAVAVHRARNSAGAPKLRYEIEPKEQYRLEMGIEDNGLELGAIYHSHPRTEPEPSPTDVNLAMHPHALYVIVGLGGADPEVRAWRIAAGQVTEASLEVVDGPPPEA